MTLSGMYAHAPTGVDLSLTRNARQVINRSGWYAKRAGEDWVATHHLLLSLLSDRSFQSVRLLRKVGITAKAVRKMQASWPSLARIEHASGAVAPKGILPFSAEAEDCLTAAVNRSLRDADYFVGTTHLLVSIIERRSAAHSVLSRLGVEVDQFRHTLEVSLEDCPEEPEPGPEVMAEHIAEWESFLDRGSPVTPFEEGRLWVAVANGREAQQRLDHVVSEPLPGERQKLVELVQAGQEALTRLDKEASRLIPRIAREYSRSSRELLYVWEQALYALSEALETFVPERDTAFLAYADLLMRQRAAETIERNMLL